MADLFEDRLQASLKTLSAAFKEKVDVTSERCFLGFDAYKKAIDCLSPGDVVLLTTHAAFRPLMFEYAVKKGVNVFMEKSFATDAPNTRRLLAAAAESEKKNLKVAVGFMWRHSQAREEAIKRIHDGMIGDLHTLRIYRVHGPTHCAKLPADTNELAFQIRNAFCFNWTSLGIPGRLALPQHRRGLLGQERLADRSPGNGGRCYPEAGNLLDHYTVEFIFPDGARLFSFSRHMAGCWDTYADYAHGTKGSAVLMTNLSTPNTRIYKSQNQTPETLIWKYGHTEINPYHREWQLLLDAIRHDKPYNEAQAGRRGQLRGAPGSSRRPHGLVRDDRRDQELEFPVCERHRPHDLRHPAADSRQRRWQLRGAPAGDHEGSVSQWGGANPCAGSGRLRSPPIFCPLAKSGGTFHVLRLHPQPARF